MKREDVLSSTCFNANDLRKGDLTLTIEEVTQEEFKAEDGFKQKKLVVAFRGQEKRLVCGKEKANELFDMLGDDTDDWPGQRIRLVLGRTKYMGKPVDCVSVKEPFQAKDKARAGRAAPRPAADEDEDEGGDDDAGDPDGAPPRSGKGLFAWVKEMEQLHEVGLLKYLNTWGKLKEFPGRIVDWDADQVSEGHVECVRKLKSIVPKPASVAAGTAEDDDIPF